MTPPPCTSHQRFCWLAGPPHSIQNAEMTPWPQVDRDQLNVFWAITKDELTKLSFDVAGMHAVAEKNFLQVSELENRLREQRAAYVYENGQNLDRMRLENEEAARELAAECAKQTNELFRLNASLRRAIENKDAEHRNQLKDVRLEYARMLNAQTGRLEDQMAQVFGAMEDRYTGLGRSVETKHMLEIQRYQYMHDKNVRLTIDRFADEIERVRMYYDDQCAKQLTLVTQLRDKLQAVADRNRYLNKQVADLKRENKQLGDDHREMETRNQHLERKVVNYDKCARAAAAADREAAKYKKMFELKSLENVVLETDNTAMKRGLEKYSDFVADALLDARIGAAGERASTCV